MKFVKKWGIISLLFLVSPIYSKILNGEKHESHLSAESDSVVFINGADLSFLPQIEDLGGIYYDEEGNPTNALQIFSDHGFNYIRLRLWHTPEDDYNNLARILNMAERIKSKNLKFLLNFHYSDTWADPGKQFKPAAWEGLSFNTLKDSMYQYTKNVLQALDTQGTLPDIVQIGNEINQGMLWNEGKVGGSYDTPEQWAKLAALINEGVKGIRESCDSGDSIGIMIHIANAANNEISHWFFDNLTGQGVEFDYIGLSYYPWWHGTLDAVLNNLNDLALRYDRDIIIVEMAYPWTLQWNDNTGNIVGVIDQLHAGYPATVSGQTNFIRDLIKIVRNVKNQKGVGLFYWAPDWISVQPVGSAWENVTLFDFEGKVLSSMDVFLEKPVDITVDYTGHEILPYFQFMQNYPNPFNQETRISYTLDRSTFVTLRVYDIHGSLIKTLRHDHQSAGTYSIIWKAHAENGAPVASGIYLISLWTDHTSDVHKMLLLK